MTIIEPKVILTKADVEVIEKLHYLCNEFDFNSWEVIDAVEDRVGLNNVTFEYLDE